METRLKYLQIPFCKIPKNLKKRSPILGDLLKSDIFKDTHNFFIKIWAFWAKPPFPSVSSIQNLAEKCLQPPILFVLGPNYHESRIFRSFVFGVY